MIVTGGEIEKNRREKERMKQKTIERKKERNNETQKEINNGSNTFFYNEIKKERKERQ